MKNLVSLSLSRDSHGELKLLDQTKLPQKEEWIAINHPSEMVTAIKMLKVRGAPIIGVAAALSLAKFASTNINKNEFDHWGDQLRKARPTAVNLMWALDRMNRAATNWDETVIERLNKIAEELFVEDSQLCDQISENGAELIGESENIITYCNTGGLATAGSGTAIGVLKQAHTQNKNIHVYVCETRPLLQGGRLTSWELNKFGIKNTLICDNMAAHLMKTKKIHRVIVGADRVSLNGDFANKIGTYSLAINAKFHGIPFHMAAPFSTIDFSCLTEKEIPIELRDQNEVRGVRDYIWAPETSNCINPAFDCTPRGLVTSYIFDFGVVSQEYIQKILAEKLENNTDITNIKSIRS